MDLRRSTKEALGVSEFSFFFFHSDCFILGPCGILPSLVGQKCRLFFFGLNFSQRILCFFSSIHRSLFSFYCDFFFRITAQSRLCVCCLSTTASFRPRSKGCCLRFCLSMAFKNLRPCAVLAFPSSVFGLIWSMCILLLLWKFFLLSFLCASGSVVLWHRRPARWGLFDPINEHHDRTQASQPKRS